jgi:hypothetical protein
LSAPGVRGELAIFRVAIRFLRNKMRSFLTTLGIIRVAPSS